MHVNVRPERYSFSVRLMFPRPGLIESKSSTDRTADPNTSEAASMPSAGVIEFPITFFFLAGAQILIAAITKITHINLRLLPRAEHDQEICGVILYYQNQCALH